MIHQYENITITINSKFNNAILKFLTRVYHLFKSHTIQIIIFCSCAQRMCDLRKKKKHYSLKLMRNLLATTNLGVVEGFGEKYQCNH
jgi:hypothetical protein